MATMTSTVSLASHLLHPANCFFFFFFIYIYIYIDLSENDLLWMGCEFSMWFVVDCEDSLVEGFVAGCFCYGLFQLCWLWICFDFYRFVVVDCGEGVGVWCWQWCVVLWPSLGFRFEVSFLLISTKFSRQGKPTSPTTMGGSWGCWICCKYCWCGLSISRASRFGGNGNVYMCRMIFMEGNN